MVLLWQRHSCIWDCALLGLPRVWATARALGRRLSAWLPVLISELYLRRDHRQSSLLYASWPPFVSLLSFASAVLLGLFSCLCLQAGPTRVISRPCPLPRCPCWSASALWPRSFSIGWARSCGPAWDPSPRAMEASPLRARGLASQVRLSALPSCRPEPQAHVYRCAHRHLRQHYVSCGFLQLQRLHPW